MLLLIRELPVAILAFDVDGTLTDARKPIDPVMLSAMLTLCTVHRVWLVTGSDEPKCREQVGSLFNAVERVYCCAGAEMWAGNTLIKSSPWNPPAQLIVDLFSALQESGYDEFTGDHIEIRTGMVNLSIPGRKATQAQRDRFNAWDVKTGVRRKIANYINSTYDQVHATLGGKTGIDVTERGRGKHVILSDDYDDMWFWCDEGKPGGNDYSLVEELLLADRDRVFHTSGWQDTYHQLKEIFDIK